MSDRGKHNLSGTWTGIYNYPRHFPPVQFEARLSDREGALHGTTYELDRVDQRDAPAQLIGTREGTQVRFTKFYDTVPRGSHDTVLYEGTLSPDGSEISGRWQLPGNWSGSFIMIRPVAESAEIEREVEAPVSRS